MSQEEQIQQTRRKIFEELTKVVDPEIGVSIMELELIDKVDIDSGKVKVDLHLTSPFCPAVFGFKIAQDVRDNIYKLYGVDGVNVNVSNQPTALPTGPRRPGPRNQSHPALITSPTPCSAPQTT